jgi:type I restriction enzyme S subunit
MTTNHKPLPPGRAWTTLGEVANTTRQRRDPQSYPDMRFIGMENVEAHTMTLLSTIPASGMKSSAEYFEAGDVLYGRLRPYLNKVVRPDFAGLCSSEFIVFRQSENLDSKYLRYFLNSSAFVAFASGLNAGDRPRVNIEQHAGYPFPLPPLAEQRRIVSEVERRLSVVEELEQAVAANLARAGRLRQAVLRRAFEGRHVPHDPNDEPAEKLLERIRAAREGAPNAPRPTAPPFGTGAVTAPPPTATAPQRRGMRRKAQR